MTAVAAVSLNRNQYLELEKIGVGAFAPLSGFMTEAQFTAVVDSMRLPDGSPFTLPVVLDVEEAVAGTLRDAARVDLTFDGRTVGHLWPEDLYGCDRRLVARRVFGTDDGSHPGVAFFQSLKPVFVGGRVELLRRARFDISADELTPAETRALFRDRGWHRVAGFQTRNVPHRAHEYLQRVALEHADGLFIQPLVGHKRAGDFTPQAVMTGYRALVGRFLPRDRVVLGVLSTVMRYAGPREAVFHAIIRRNYGCSHFIVGRDHAGVGDWYGTYEAHDLTRQFDGDLGIEIMRLHGPFFCAVCDGIATERTCAHIGTDATCSISGTDMRRILMSGQEPDPRLMRPEIVAALTGLSLFVDE